MQHHHTKQKCDGCHSQQKLPANEKLAIQIGKCTVSTIEKL